MENVILTETGIHIDDLGRIVIPRTIRKSAKIMEGEKLDLFLTNDGSIILRKSETTKVELSPIVEPEKIIYTFENPYDNNYRVVSITPEQDKLLEWLCDNECINGDVNITHGYPNCEDLTK